jgi:hypothetical protein
MELAIPLVALGGLYVIQNNNKDKSATNPPKKQEAFGSLYPSDNRNKKNPFDDQEIVDSKPHTDAYFYTNDSKKTNSFYLEDSKFQHNNMVPFSKPKGGAYSSNINESALDNMMGGGSQYIKKVEQAPLFKPQENIQWSNGAPNQSDFFQSRVNPSMMKTNLKPFESEYVGPGLNQGFGKDGSGGFNSGMESRDLWMPKTVDDLRVATNPKLEYELLNHEGPANSSIKNVGTIGRVEKQRPDTFFVNSQDRWFTTGGQEKGVTLRSIQETGNVRRLDGVTDYSGPATSNLKAGVAPEYFEKSRRQEPHEGSVNHSSAVGRGPSNADTILKSHTAYKNNRNNQNQTLGGALGGGAIGAVIAPFLDMLKPSRKDETVNNLRIYGELSNTVPRSYVVNGQDDAVKTTIKETTIHSAGFNINNQKEGAYQNNQMVFDPTQRESAHTSYTGMASSKYGDRTYDSVISLNDTKSATIMNRPNQGGTQLFNASLNVNIAKKDGGNYYVAGPSALIAKAPSKEIYGHQNSSAPQPVYNNRNDADLLSALKQNPYTLSITGM